MSCVCSSPITQQKAFCVITTFVYFFYVQLLGQTLGEDESRGEKSRSINLNAGNKCFAKSCLRIDGTVCVGVCKCMQIRI